MNIINELEWRGLIQDTSDPDLSSKLNSKMAFYVGFDPTAQSLQLGNLVPLITSIRLGLAGLKPVILLGGATGSIGDPSGKSEERKLLSQSDVEKNSAVIKEQISAIMKKYKLEPVFVNNIDWTQPLSIIDFLRDIGKHFTVNFMLSKEVVKSRLGGSGISYTEFSYMLLQANDFLHLFQHHNCQIQIGGSDQWGNMTAGLELIRRKGLSEAFAFSFPLITDSSGKKFGKSEGGSIWLNSHLTSPFTLHQYFLNVADTDVIAFLKVFTFLSQTEIADLEQKTIETPQDRAAQHVLADSVCNMLHGEVETGKANASAKVLFGGSIDGISDERLLEIFANVPSSEISRTEAEQLTILDALVKTNLLKSRGEAKRLLQNGGGYLNNNRVTSGDVLLKETDVLDRQLFILRSGKKSYHVVKLV